MKISTHFSRPENAPPLALSIGMFDGVHRGHQALIERLNILSRERNLESAILTFWPHPRLVFNPQDELKLLNTIEEKQYLLAKSGLQHLFLKSFDEDFRNLPAQDFVRDILVGRLKVQHLIIGHDHTFGKNRSGNFELLQNMSQELNFDVEQIEAVQAGELNISSTQIRKALSLGNVASANEMLGYHYSLSGTVVHGRKIGRTIGYPTANIEVSDQKLLPEHGAYIVEVFTGGEKHKGMLSIGNNPTVDGQQTTVEVYILDFDRDLYGCEISVNFREFLHEQIKFDGLDSLLQRLDEDKRLTEQFQY